LITVKVVAVCRVEAFESRVFEQTSREEDPDSDEMFRFSYSFGVSNAQLPREKLLWET